MILKVLLFLLVVDLMSIPFLQDLLVMHTNLSHPVYVQICINVLIALYLMILIHGEME